MSGRRSLVCVALAATLIALSGCGAIGTADPLDVSAPGYLQPGVEFWDGWKVPAGTVGIATAFPEPDPQPMAGRSEDTERVTVDFLVTGDPHQVIRDLHDQITRRELRPVMPREYDSVCDQHRDRYGCRLYGQGEDGLTKLAAQLEIDESPEPGDVPNRLQIHLGAYHHLDGFQMPSLRPIPIQPTLVSPKPGRMAPTRPAGRTRPKPTRLVPGRPPGYERTWVDATPPVGKAPVRIPTIDPDTLAPGAELPFFGMSKTVGTVPEGSRLLAPPYQAAATYGFGGTFVITERRDKVLAELRAMAAEAATGDRNPDVKLTAGDLTAHRVSFDGSGGGCGATLDSVDLASGIVAARLTIICD